MAGWATRTRTLETEESGSPCESGGRWGVSAEREGVRVSPRGRLRSGQAARKTLG